MHDSSDIPVIAIDGPGGSGKGTVARRLARRLGWHLLDSGAIYRLLALAALERSIAPDDEPALVALAGKVRMAFEPGEAGVTALLDGRVVDEELRSEECGNAASRLAALSEVRRALLARQRAFRRPPGLVADGRDMGTVVFPDAVLKVFLTASADERARRRYNQLKEKGLDANLARLSREIAERDRRGGCGFHGKSRRPGHRKGIFLVGRPFAERCMKSAAGDTYERGRSHRPCR